MLTMELLRSHLSLSETFIVPFRFLCRPAMFQALSMRFDAFDPCGSRGYNTLPWFLLFLRTPHTGSSSFDTAGREAGRDDAVQLMNEYELNRDPCSDSLTV